MNPIAPAQQEFGRLPAGDPVFAVLLTNRNGMAVRTISYGAAIQSVRVPGPNGTLTEVTYGHDCLQPYLDHPQYAGATVGRVANRIAGARFALDGQVHHLAQNDGNNALHGGLRGFDKVNWRIEDLAGDSVTYDWTSPDGDQGFPGNLTVRAIYRLDDHNRLSVEYIAASDAPTIVALSNHAYWNLAGAGSGRSAIEHLLTIHADCYLPVDSALIPTGELRPVEGTPFDFRVPTVIGARIRTAAEPQLHMGRGYDHNWVLGPDQPDPIREIALLEDPWSGRTLRLDSNQPGVQFYSGNFFDGTVAGHGGWLARAGDFIALEPQAFPDSANRPQFGSIRLIRGETYRNVIGWSFGTQGGELQ